MIPEIKLGLLSKIIITYNQPILLETHASNDA